MKMTIRRAICVGVIIFNFSVNVVAELTMPSCILGWITVEENKEITITCSHRSQIPKVHWRIEDANINQTLFEGSCAIYRKKCTFSTSDSISLYVDKYLEFSLVINTTNVRSYGGATVTCFDSKTHQKCRINVIHIPNLSECKIEVDTVNNTVTGSCNINKFFWYNSPASCTAIRRNGTRADDDKYVPSQISLEDYTDSEDNKPYKRGNCSFITDLPTAIGNYTYTIIVGPSQVDETAGKINIGESETNCAISFQANPKCFWECFKRPGDTSNYDCNPLKGGYMSETSFKSSSPAHLGSSSAHYATSHQVPLSSFLSAAFDSPTTQVSSSSSTPVSSSSLTHFASSQLVQSGSSPSTHVSSSPSIHVSSSSLTHFVSSQLVPFGLSTLHPSKNRGPAVANIVAGVVVALLVIIIVIIIIYIVKRKQNQSWTLPKIFESLRGDNVTRQSNRQQLRLANLAAQNESFGENRESDDFFV